MGVEVASLYASLEANVTPLETSLAAADAGLTALAEQASVTTDVVAGLGVGAGTAAEGLAVEAEAAGAAAAGLEFLGQAGLSTSAAEDTLAAQSMAAAQAEYGLAVASEEAAASTDIMATANTVATSAMMGLAGAGIAVGLAVGAAKGVLDNTVGSAVSLGDEVRKLQFETGASADSASKLAYAADVTGVGVDSLSRGINIATRALESNKSLGIEPNIDGLAKLSDMYLQIEDPIQRNAFLLHEFGRSGADLAPLMALGSDGIKALGDQAQLTGNVLDQQAVTSLHNYEVQVNQLTIDTKGLGVAMGVELVPAATRVVDGALNLTHTLDLVNAAQKDGIITAFGQTTIFAELATGTRTLKSVYDELAPKVEQINNDMANGADASDRAAQSAKYLADTQAAASDTTITMADNTSVLTDRYGVANLGAQALADATAKLTVDQQDATATFELQAGMAGTVTKAEQSYSDTVEADAPKLAKLRAELAQYTAAQGENVVVVDKGKYSAEDLDKAQTQLQIAEERLAETHSKSKATLDSLALSVQTAQDRVDKMTAGQATASTTTADYTTKIAALKAQIDPLVAAEGAAKDAIDKATASLLYQAVSSNLPIEAQTKLAHSLGLMSDADYNLTVQAEALKAEYLAGKITIDQLDSSLAALKYNTENASAAVVPLAGHMGDAGSQAGAAAGQIGNLNEQIAALHDKTVNITVNQKTNASANVYETGIPPAGGNSGSASTPPAGGQVWPGGASGLSMDVPAGYPDDTFYVRASSNEHVEITSPGQSGRGGGGMSIGAIHIHADSADSGQAIWNKVKAAAARETRAQTMAGIQAAGG